MQLHSRCTSGLLAPALVAAALLSMGCHGSPAGPDGGFATHRVHGCNPLVEGQCLTPYPSSWFEQPDATSPTGVRVVLPDAVMPANTSGVVVHQTAAAASDGFSPATPIVLWPPSGVDVSQLPALDHEADSLDAGCPIALVNVRTGARLPFFAELDANANPDAGERQALLIHPAARLDPGGEYAVALLTSLRDAHGQPFAASGDFEKWRDGSLPSSSPLAEIADRLDQDAQAFAAVGISRSELALAWDFDVARDPTAPLRAMVDQALAAPLGTYSVSSVEEPDAGADPDALRIVEGTFQAPSFETGADPSPLNRAPDGGAIMGAPASWNFTAIIPRCAATSAPVPLLIIGHGLFDTADSELHDDRFLLQDLCMVGIGTDWLGVAGTADEGRIADVLEDGNKFWMVTDRLQQAHVNFQVLTRMAMGPLASDPAFQIAGKPAYDPSQRYYWGASNGGIQGATFMSLSRDIDRGVLNVPGSEWSLMIWRSSHFDDAIGLLDIFYPDKLTQQVLIANSQMLWDATDPIEFLPSLPPGKQVLLQESEGDAQVPNVSTRIEARTVHAVALGTLIQPVFGLSGGDAAHAPVVYTQWTVHPEPLPPPTDTPPQDNAAHEAVRRLPAAIEQVRDFLRPDGGVVDTCGGPCDFPPDGGA